MELYNWQLCEYTCVRSACLQILHRGIGDPRPRALFALAVLLSHRKILRPLWFPREGWWGRRHPCYKLVVANKFQSLVRVYFFWVWRLNNKQHWFVAATWWARTNVKGDHIMVIMVIKWDKLEYTQHYASTANGMVPQQMMPIPSRQKGLQLWIWWLGRYIRGQRRAEVDPFMLLLTTQSSLGTSSMGRFYQFLP